MKCACGKTALYRFGGNGYCSEHRLNAVKDHGVLHYPKAKVKFSLDTAPKHMSKVKKQERRQGLLKANKTPAEALLLKLLAENPKTSGKYTFQPILYGFYPDFLNQEARLIVELDGWHHYTPKGIAKDERRTAVFEKSAYRVIRFQNKEVMERSEHVMNSIIKAQNRV